MQPFTCERDVATLVRCSGQPQGDASSLKVADGAAVGLHQITNGRDAHVHAAAEMCKGVRILYGSLKNGTQHIEAIAIEPYLPGCLLARQKKDG